MAMPLTEMLLLIVAFLALVASKTVVSEEPGATPPSQLLPHDQLLAVPAPPQVPSIPLPVQVIDAALARSGQRKRRPRKSVGRASERRRRMTQREELRE